MGTRGPKPGEGGAPCKVIDLDVVRRAASIGCTVGEIATLVGIARRTFFNHLKEDEGLQDVIDEGRDQGRATLRRLQWQQANAGNPTMLIWLGKQLLGQRDKLEVEEDPARPSLTFLHLTAMKAFSDQLSREREEQEHPLRAPPTINGEATPVSGNGTPPRRNLFEPALE